MLKGKVFVITGSTQGIGLRTAEKLAIMGASVVINSRNADKVDKVSAKFREQGLTVLGVAGDVSDINFCQTLRMSVIDYFGKIDFLINNAGLAAKGTLENMKAEVYRHIFDVNVMGSLNPTIAMLQDIKRSQGGIIFISSLAGVLGLPSYSAYSSTKGAIIKLAESLKNELVDDKVFVGVNHPGFTENAPDKTMITGSGEAKVMSKRTDVTVDPLDKTVDSIIAQLRSRQFRVFSSRAGTLLHLVYRLSPRLSLFALQKKRHKIMKME